VQRKIGIKNIEPILLAMPGTQDPMTQTANSATTVDLNVFCDAAKSLAGHSPASEF
jgi:hypothetical protein